MKWDSPLCLVCHWSVFWGKQFIFSFLGSVQSSKEILDLLYRNPVYTLAQRLIGKDKVAPVQQGQIALRFPELDPPPLTLSGTQWHIDGFGKGMSEICQEL